MAGRVAHPRKIVTPKHVGSEVPFEQVIDIGKQRIQSRVVVSDSGCWLWQGFINPDNGYGMLGFQSANHRAHRLAYRLWKGEIPAGMDVCHTCDVRRCVNPDHLWVGTRQDNITDMALKKRGCQQKRTHCPKGHEYSEFVAKYKGGTRIWRRCNTCHNERSKLRWHTNPEFRAKQYANRKARRQRLISTATKGEQRG